ncbi:hypothetical protein PAXRUDRAFT_26403 [Paxillus rubicundulus Ve08.2h10]|uniref:Uncharacterized protein n=1 Tax=Paxillus rubicundulus Ve08.2h10 TaxID=930991 RepID=A0A0D0E0E0_9AGAM|nr:hypothetical protein PAXRUDRAFT_26403 [Paxillus rubicundulus Ve08.2h10]
MWTTLVEAWEGDRTKPNPYEWKGEVMSQVNVQLELARDEAQRLQHRNDVSLHAKISPSILISTGLDLEDQQLEQWSSVQALYMPLVAWKCSPKGDIPMESTIAELQPHTYKLWLPSEKPKLSSILLQNFEWKLHYAQAFDSLEDLQQITYEVKDQTPMHEIPSKDQRQRFKATLPKKVSLESTLQELKDMHIHPLSVGEGGQSEGHHIVSWIWQTTGVLGNNNTDLQESLQIECCKSQARVNRWSEEVMLLMEEMQRVLKFFTSKMKWCHEHASKQKATGDDICEGLGAYAAHEAALYHALKLACKVDWIKVLKCVLKGEERHQQHIHASTRDKLGACST